MPDEPVQDTGTDPRAPQERFRDALLAKTNVQWVPDVCDTDPDFEVLAAVLADADLLAPPAGTDTREALGAVEQQLRAAHLALGGLTPDPMGARKSIQVALNTLPALASSPSQDVEIAPQRAWMAAADQAEIGRLLAVERRSQDTGGGEGLACGGFTVEMEDNPYDDGGGVLVRIGVDGEPGRWPVGCVVINEDSVYHCLDPVKGDESPPACDDRAMDEILRALDRGQLSPEEVVEAVSEAVTTTALRPLLEDGGTVRDAPPPASPSPTGDRERPSDLEFERTTPCSGDVSSLASTSATTAATPSSTLPPKETGLAAAPRGSGSTPCPTASEAGSSTRPRTLSPRSSARSDSPNSSSSPPSSGDREREALIRTGRSDKYGQIYVAAIGRTGFDDPSEPVALLRAQDRYALPAMCHYLEMLRDLSDAQPEQVASVERQVAAFRAWRGDNPDRVRTPGASPSPSPTGGEPGELEADAEIHLVVHGHEQLKVIRQRVGDFDAGQPVDVVLVLTLASTNGPVLARVRAALSTGDDWVYNDVAVVADELERFAGQLSEYGRQHLLEYVARLRDFADGHLADPTGGEGDADV